MDTALYGPMDETVQRMIGLLKVRYMTTDDGGLVDTPDKVERHWRRFGRILVWTGFSDDTIYGGPRINHRARAWHDYCHIMTGQNHTPHAEWRVANFQQAQVCKLATWLSVEGKRTVCQLLDLEINGQIEYWQETGGFPENQRQFTRDRMWQVHGVSFA